MATLHVVSSKQLAGKTAIAVGLGHGFAGLGRVRLVRTGSGMAADADAATYAAYLFASSSGSPLAADALSGIGDDGTAVVEAEAGAIPASGPVLLVVRGAPTEADTALVSGLGDRLIGTIATDVPPAQIEAVARELTNAGLRPLALIPEDRMIASPSVGEIRDILGAKVLYEGENTLEVVEDILLSPVYADPARPHFRRFNSKAIIAPFNKTDFHLAAIETQAACLVITGGHDPSPYVVDRAQGEATTVLLAPQETPATLTALSDVWLTSRFRGERKAAAVYAHLEGRIDFAALQKKLG